MSLKGPPTSGDTIERLASVVRALAGRLGKAENAVKAIPSYVIWVQAADPGVSAHDGDVWVRPGGAGVYARISGAWNEADHTYTIPVVTVSSGGSAFKIFVQPTDPGGAAAVGDVWIDTS